MSVPRSGEVSWGHPLTRNLKWWRHRRFFEHFGACINRNSRNLLNFRRFSVDFWKIKDDYFLCPKLTSLDMELRIYIKDRNKKGEMTHSSTYIELNLFALSKLVKESDYSKMRRKKSILESKFHIQSLLKFYANNFEPNS